MVVHNTTNKANNTNNMSITIESVKTARLVGRCVLRGAENKTKQLWKMQWVPEHKELVKGNAGRIYLMVSRTKDKPGVIKKIGKSECKGGMANTMAFYQGGLGGSPSVRTFGIHHLIANELKAGNEFEIWGIWSSPVKVQVPGLFETSEMLVTPSIHCMEDKCREDYKKIMGDFPPWNYQERGAAWPKDIYEMYQKQIASRKRTDKAATAKKASKKKEAHYGDAWLDAMHAGAAQ